MKRARGGVVKRLSYADPIVAVSLLVALAASAYIAYSSYQAASFYAFEEPRYVSDEKYYVDVARRILDSLLMLDLDYWEYAGTDEDYYNMEHPPLAKFVIAAAIVACGDEPLCWRLPSIALGSLTPLVLWAGFQASLGGRRGAVAGAVAAAATASDPVFRVMSSVAMLDIYQAFFTAVAIALAAAGRYRLASIAAGLAAASKPSGVAAVVAVASVYGASRGGVRERLAAAAESSAIALAVVAAFYIALTLLFAFSPGSPFAGSALERLEASTLYVLEETYRGIRWHTTSRPEGPPASDPVGWVLNENPFYLSYTPLPLPAVTNTLLHASAAIIALSVFAAEIVSGARLWPGPGHVFLVSLYLVYAAVMLAGNTTLYSFYAAQLTPAAAAVMGEAAAVAYTLYQRGRFTGESERLGGSEAGSPSGGPEPGLRDRPCS